MGIAFICKEVESELAGGHGMISCGEGDRWRFPLKVPVNLIIK